MNMSSSKKLVYIVLMLAFALVLSSCASGPKTRSITLSAEDIVWDQSRIELKVGETVNLSVRNDGVLDHTFVAKELDLNVMLSPGEVVELSFVVTEAGSLSYICDIPGHEEAGMAGEFIVSE